VVGDPNQRKAVLGSDGVVAEEYLGVQFQAADVEIRPGSRATLWMDLWLTPVTIYEALRPGATFTIREGAKIVAYGRVLQRKDPN
jgi:hypothetical protein